MEALNHKKSRKVYKFDMPCVFSCSLPLYKQISLVGFDRTKPYKVTLCHHDFTVLVSQQI